MTTQTQNLHLWQGDPFLPVDWRARDADRLLAGETACWADDDDPYIQEYIAYLRSVAAGASPAQPAASLRWAVLSKARELAQQDDPRRWLVEAAIMAGESDTQIADRCGLDPEVVATFEHLFFAVRDSLSAEGWILTQVIGRGIWQGFQDAELSHLWRAFSYFGRSLILNTLIEHFFASWQPGEPATISVYFNAKSTAPLELQAAIASRAIPHDEAAGVAFMHIHGKMIAIEQTMSGIRAEATTDELKRETIRPARAYLTGKPLILDRSAILPEKAAGAEGTIGATGPGGQHGARLLADLIASLAGPATSQKAGKMVSPASR